MPQPRPRTAATIHRHVRYGMITALATAGGACRPTCRRDRRIPSRGPGGAPVALEPRHGARDQHRRTLANQVVQLHSTSRAVTTPWEDVREGWRETWEMLRRPPPRRVVAAVLGGCCGAVGGRHLRLWTAAADLRRDRATAGHRRLPRPGRRDLADGRRIAFAEGRRLFEMPVGGGARVQIGRGRRARFVTSPPGDRAWIFEDAGAATTGGSRRRARRSAALQRRAESSGQRSAIRRHAATVDELRQLAASPDGHWFAAVAGARPGSELWRVATDGSRAELTGGADVLRGPPGRRPARSRAPMASLSIGAWRLSLPCGEAPLPLTPEREVIGPLAFSRRRVVLRLAERSRNVDLWTPTETRRAPRGRLRARQLRAVDPADGTRVQDAELPHLRRRARPRVGTYRQLSTLQAETPSYHPDGRQIAVTYGTWRRVLDDAKYPDIAQEIGVFRRCRDAPAARRRNHRGVGLRRSGDGWSPNGKWIAFHSHREQSDDVWLRPAASGRDPIAASRFSAAARKSAGRAGRPTARWCSSTARARRTRSVRSSSASTRRPARSRSPPREVPVPVSTARSPRRMAARQRHDRRDRQGRARPHVITTVPVDGGDAAIVHRFASEHDFPGTGGSPDGRSVAFVAPAPDGFYQIFRCRSPAVRPQQMTHDRIPQDPSPPGHPMAAAWPTPSGATMRSSGWVSDTSIDPPRPF